METIEDVLQVESDSAPANAFERIVAACLDLEWQIMPRLAQRGVRASPQVEEKLD
jgi:hypothetical protein